MTKHSKKQRLSVYLEPEIMKALSAHAARRGHSLSLVAEAGIASFLSPDAAERQEAAITKRLDQIDRRMTRIERDLGIAVETLAIFVRFWLTTTPALPEPAAQPPAPRPLSVTRPLSRRSAVGSLRGRNSGRRFRKTSRRPTTIVRGRRTRARGKLRVGTIIVMAIDEIGGFHASDGNPCTRNFLLLCSQKPRSSVQGAPLTVLQRQRMRSSSSHTCSPGSTVRPW